MTTKKIFSGKTSRLDAPPTNDRSFDEPPAKKRKYFKCSVKSDQHKDLKNEELTKCDPKVKNFMQKYWRVSEVLRRKEKCKIYTTFFMIEISKIQ